MKTTEKLEIQFYNNRALGKNHSYWSKHLGKIVRSNNICPIQVKTWKDIAESSRQHMWDCVKVWNLILSFKYIFLDVLSFLKSPYSCYLSFPLYVVGVFFQSQYRIISSTLDHMGALWTTWRSSLNAMYVKKCKTKAEVLKNVPEEMNSAD